MNTRCHIRVVLSSFVLDLSQFPRRPVFVYQYQGRTFLSFTLSQSTVKTQQFEIIVTACLCTMTVNKILLTKTVFIKSIIL